MEKAPPTSVSQGVLRSLPAKLDSLLSSAQGHGLRLGKQERKIIYDLKGILKKLIDSHLMGAPDEAPAPTASRWWVKEVCELSYDIDDFVDELVHVDPVQRNLCGKVSTMAKLRECLSRCRWTADQVSRFRARVEKVIQSHKRYNPDQGSRETSSIVSSGERPFPPLDGVGAARLIGMNFAIGIGIESSMNKIGGWLTDEGEQQLRVVSIVGLGGVGKTTLAKQLYSKIGGRQFHCRAFVRSSQKPDMKRLLTSILLQVRPHQPPDAFESCNLINTIRAHLQHKRYFIIIDDLWASSTWDIIHLALPDDNRCSRILTTTEVDNVARRCCGQNSKHIFKMEPLSDEDSRELFFSRATGNKFERRQQLNQVPYEIIRKCGGFPLATIATAGLLARQPNGIEHWNDIWNSLSSSLKTNPTTDGMKQVLIICYNKLPDHLKPCMLYLSIYQEDHIIRKDDLVKQWIAEGFICETERKDMVEVACTYFDELINRGMIQPVEIKYNGEVLSCSVHYMILHLIRYKAIKENLVTAIDHSETDISLADKVRRLSLHFGDAEDVEPPEKLKLTQVRSLVFFGLFKCLPSIEEFRLLRVLILHLWSDQDNISFDLTTVCKLFRLRYLEISCNVTLNLQSQLQGLQYLETLKIDSRGTELPPDIVHLPRLLHLSFPGDTNMPNGIRKMTSLQTLECIDLSRNSPDNVLSLNELINLWDLRLTCPTVPSDNLEKNMERLAKVLPQLKYLKSLTLSPAPGSSNANTVETSSSSKNISCDGLSKVSSLPEPLERIELSPRICIFSSLPRWINQELSKLRILKIAAWELCQNDIVTLKRLSALTSLSLYVRAIAKRIVFHKDGFPVLKHFKFISTSLRIEIEEGAMPNVRRLKLGFSANTTDEYSPKGSGFEHLTGLEEISAKIGSAHADEYRRNVAESELETAFRPRKVNVKWVHSIFIGHQGKTTEAQKGEHQILGKPYVITNGGSNGQYVIGEKASTEDRNRRADSRTTVSTESTSHMQSPGGKKTWGPVDGIRLTETTQIMKYVTGKLFKLETFHIKTELAAINKERELMTIIIEKSPGALPERWVLQLLDLVYDIEDFVDICNRMFVISRKETSISARIIRRARVLVHMSHIVSLNHRIRSLKEWQQSAISSRGGGTTAASSGQSAGTILRPYALREELVGMDKALDELLDMLLLDDEKVEQQKVISIVGCRGVGKTILAEAVYRHPHVQKTFHSCNWVVASGCNTAGELLSMIVQQVLDDYPPASRKTISDFYLLNKLYHMLSGKRCLVVIDDLERAGLWYDIQGAFLGTHAGSRIIVTTGIQSVAAGCSPERYIYRMGVLGKSESKELFWKKVRSRANCTPALENAFEETFSKCDGLPLALVSVANYLREKGQNLHQLQPGPGAFEEVNRVLMQCYDSLPDHGHRACLLSLSIFPKGHCIKRKSLIRRWIAEGVVVGDDSGTRNAEQVGGDRFDELIDRNLIEPVLIGNNAKVKRCRVHGVMLEFIVNKAVSRNMVTLIRKDEPLPNQKGAHPIRRLSVHGSTAESGRVAATVGLNHVRSLTVCNGEIFYFQSCQLVRVLDLEGCKGVDEWSLHCICKLILLKYLSLRGSNVRWIPKKIEKLECLETLDVRETHVNKLPLEVIMLPRLAHLFGQFELPRELEDEKRRSKLEAFFSEKSVLQTLSGFIMDKNSGFELILLHMRFLRKLKIWCMNSMTTDSENLLAYSLQKSFSKDNGLESLSIDFSDQSINFLDSVLLEGPCMLSSIKLRGRLSKLPNFITLLDTTLSELQLCLTCLSIEDLSVLQHFPRLLYLKLVEGPRAFWGGRFVVQRDGFPSLRRLCFQAPELPEVHIHEGGMSSVNSLHLLCPEFTLCSKFSGIQYLKHLNEVVLHPSVGDEEMYGWKMEAERHENRPKVYRHPISA